MTGANVDVVVAGAGPAGSATAAFLAGRGFDVTLIDRATFPRDKACSEYLSPEAARLLEALGVLERVQTDAARLRGMTVVGPGGSAFTGLFANAGPPRGIRDFGLALPRREFDQALVAAATARGARLLEGVRVEGIEGSGRTRSVQLRERSGRARTLAARLVIGADGVQSRLAARLGLARRGRLRRVAFVTHATGVAGMGDLGEMHVGSGVYAGLAPVGRGLTNVAVVMDARYPIAGRTPFERLEAGIARVPAVAERLREASFVGPVLGAGPFAHRTVRASADRVALVGDAADFYDPFTGEGIYAALRGAELLASEAAALLERDDLSANALGAYDAARRRAFGGKWLIERAIAYAVARPRLFERIAGRLARRSGMADLLVGVTGDFVPPRTVLRPSYLMRLVL